MSRLVGIESLWVKTDNLTMKLECVLSALQPQAIGTIRYSQGTTAMSRLGARGHPSI